MSVSLCFPSPVKEWGYEVGLHTSPGDRKTRWRTLKNRWVYWRTHRVLCQYLAVCLTNAVGRKGSWHNGRCSMKGSINELVSMDETWKYRWRPVSTTVGSWHHSRLDRLAVVDGWYKSGKNQAKIRQKSKSGKNQAKIKINQNQAKIRQKSGKTSKVGTTVPKAFGRAMKDLSELAWRPCLFGPSKISRGKTIPLLVVVMWEQHHNMEWQWHKNGLCASSQL